MKILLDTHYLLWALGDINIKDSVRDLIIDPANEVYFSVASLCEISLKRKIHADQMPMCAREAREAFISNGYLELSFDPLHAETMDDLPMLHRDPFDRMLLAQAKSEGMKLLSHDDRLPNYGDFVIAA